MPIIAPTIGNRYILRAVMLISVLPDLGTGMIVKKEKAERIPLEPKEKVPPSNC